VLVHRYPTKGGKVSDEKFLNDTANRLRELLQNCSDPDERHDIGDALAAVDEMLDRRKRPADEKEASPETQPDWSEEKRALVEMLNQARLEACLYHGRYKVIRRAVQAQEARPVSPEEVETFAVSHGWSAADILREMRRGEKEWLRD
jgi:hypothetical protein